MVRINTILSLRGAALIRGVGGRGRLSVSSLLACRGDIFGVPVEFFTSLERVISGFDQVWLLCSLGCNTPSNNNFRFVQ